MSCPRTFVFFRLMVSAKSLQACEKQSINDWSCSWAWVATAASSGNSMSLMRSLRTFVLALRRARLKSLSSERVRKYIPSVVVTNRCFSNRPKKLPNSIGARTQPCLTPLRISNVSEKPPLICTVPFLSVWKNSIMLCNLGGQPSSSIVYHRLIYSTQSVGAMLWSIAQLRRGQLRMVVDVVGSC